MSAPPDSPAQVSAGLEEQGYLCPPEAAMAVLLALRLHKPVLVEGPAGSGKTELAKTCARWLQLPLFRLQCYEGLDESRALYEWKYGKQLLYVQMLQAQLQGLLAGSGELGSALERLHSQAGRFFAAEFLEARPVLQALQSERGAVLLIDEVDKSGSEFEAFLLEALAENQVSIPELGVVRATHPPLVFLTSNQARDMSEALLRRCLHLHLPHPTIAREAAILARKTPALLAELRLQAATFVAQLRTMTLQKPPSLSETLDWARALELLGCQALDEAALEQALPILLKRKEDSELARSQLPKLAAELAMPH